MVCCSLIMPGCAHHPPVSGTNGHTIAEIHDVEIRENTVLFFSLTDDEYLELERDPDSGIYGTVDNLYYSLARTIEQIKALGILVVVSASLKFKFVYNNGAVKFVVREGRRVGMIYFGGGKDPHISYGTRDEGAIMQNVNEYFNIE